jgi:hypothetical protein
MAFRNIILARLDELGKTPWWLATTQKTTHRWSVMSYLHGQRQAKADSIEEMFGILGIDLKPRKKFRIGKGKP